MSVRGDLGTAPVFMTRSVERRNGSGFCNE
jgi:hypothetical protein